MLSRNGKPVAETHRAQAEIREDARIEANLHPAVHLQFAQLLGVSSFNFRMTRAVCTCV